MTKRAVKIVISVLISFLLAMMLAIIPLPNWLNWLRPEWVVLVVIYWMLVLPCFSLAFICLIGLLLDVLTGTILGAHALVLVGIAYFIARFNRRLRLFGLWQQALVVLIVIIGYQALLFWIESIAGSALIVWQYWLTSLTSALLWPFLFLLLDRGVGNFLHTRS
ncbi:MAG: rod shape-determining protein MreD [Gammaproteobacteria bacterium]|nr:rod shape-determining protein MreD [Gammaproteobacteria bacterium]